MADVIVKMFASVTVDTDSAATIDVQDDGVIEGIFADLSSNGMDALDDSADMEISFSSSNSFTTNDARASIMTMRVGQQFLTSGGGSNGKAAWISPPTGIPVAAGERIHLHLQRTAGVTVIVHAYLYLVARRGRVRRRNR